MKKIITFLLLLSSFGSLAQSYQENLEKYWYFRNRLKEEFIYFSNNENDLGSHMPAECRSDTLIYDSNEQNAYEQHFIRWGDGAWWLGHYIAVLALEYRLLKDNNQDYSGTLNELIQALNTYDRLDLVIETCFENGSPAWNGFFARDDVPESNEQFFPRSSPTQINPYLVIESDYKNSCNISSGNVPSQDQIISLFLGLRLVNTLVGELNVNDKVQEITGNIIDRMHHSYDLLGLGIDIEVWEIINPVTGFSVPIGGDLASLYPQIWAIAEAAGKITYHDEHESYSDDIITKEVWDNVQNTILAHFDEGTPITIPIWIGIPSLGIPPMFFGVYNLYGEPFNAYMIAVLSTLCNEPGGGYSNTYEWLVNFNNDTKGFLGMPEDIGLYPHLPLINRILYGYNGSNLISANEYETKFLNNAPPCGAHHYIYQNNGVTIDEVTSPPWHTISLGCPQHNSGSWYFDGEYNMIDYMILYNSYFLNYLYGEYKPALVDVKTYPIVEFEVHLDPEPPYYPDTTWIISCTCEEPKVLHASRQIDTKANILVDGGLNCFAGSSIRMLPNFKVESEGCFKAVINSTLLQNFYYQETNVNTCTGGNLSPVSNMVEDRHSPSLFQKTSPHLTFYKNEDSTFKTSSGFNLETADDITPNVKNSNVAIDPLPLVYPNPSIGLFNINSTISIKSIFVYNSFGLVVLSTEEGCQNSLTFDLTNHPKGVYYLKVVSSAGVTPVKIVKL